MKFRKRLLAVLILAGIAALVLNLAIREANMLNALHAEENGEAQIARNTLVIWYTDADFSEYIQSAAVSFSERPENQHVRIMPVLAGALEYLENINRASIDFEGPDLFIIGHDNLEKAYLAGLADIIDNDYFLALKADYPKVGLNAVTYKNKVLAYPFYFETSAFLYNRTHLENMVKAKILSDADEAAAEQAMLDLETHGPEEEIMEVPAYMEEVLRLQNDLVYIENQVALIKPKTFEDLKVFANDYDAPATVEGLLKWDVNDIFYNYFFIGNAISVGGDSGDDIEMIDIYNPEAIRSMRMYQNLSQFFAIEAKEAKYSRIIDEFIEGKLVFTVATTDVVAKLEEAIRNDNFPYEYGILRTPDIDENTPTRPLSMVNSIVINGYSVNKEDANRFAAYLSGEFAENLYQRTGKIPALSNVTPDNEHLFVFYEEFTDSVPLPKMIETSNFWIQLQITFARIWQGENANEQLKRLYEQIMSQVTGASFLAETIAEDIEIIEIEYLDEEELIREAMFD
ncbi:MAG: extracellular solute-binding protein [Lachnospiraceae bacterium]|nr:extracellular solute-binding protein [Lachnospiraceae bacterium]